MEQLESAESAAEDLRTELAECKRARDDARGFSRKQGEKLHQLSREKAKVRRSATKAESDLAEARAALERVRGVVAEKCRRCHWGRDLKQALDGGGDGGENCTCEPESGGYVCTPCLLRDYSARAEVAEARVKELEAEKAAWSTGKDIYIQHIQHPGFVDREVIRYNAERFEVEPIGDDNPFNQPADQPAESGGEKLCLICAKDRPQCGGVPIGPCDRFERQPAAPEQGALERAEAAGLPRVALPHLIAWAREQEGRIDAAHYNSRTQQQRIIALEQRLGDAEDGIDVLDERTKAAHKAYRGHLSALHGYTFGPDDG